MIPRKAHFIWFGKRPEWVEKNIEAFRSLHPDWQIKLHSEKTDWLSYIPPSLRKTAIDMEYCCSRADLLRYAILYEEGGLYLDADCLALRSFESLLDLKCFAGRHVKKRLVNNGVMGAVSGAGPLKHILAECQRIASNGQAEERTSYGPKLLTSLYGESNNGLKVLPSNYFYPVDNSRLAHKIWRKPEQERKQAIANLRYSEPPYCLHLWGVDDSTHRKTYGHGDALAYRLLDQFGRTKKITGAEIGVYKGRMSRHILRICPNLFLSMIDLWDYLPSNEMLVKGEAATKENTGAHMRESKHTAKLRTAFAKRRRTMIEGESIEVAKTFADGSLDFVFIDAEHTCEAALADLQAWYPKVKPGGLVSGHDYDNYVQPDWNVKLAVEQFMRKTCPQAELDLGADYTYFFKKS